MKRLPLDQYLAMRQRRRWAGCAAMVLLLTSLSWADHHGLLLYHSDQIDYHGKQFTVVRVVDGDTLDVDVPDGDRRTTRVRLWGIDTPELAHDHRAAEPFAEQARIALAQRCEGQTVTLYLEPYRTRGVYGRLMAHVEFVDRTFAGETLLSLGLARYEGRWVHSRLAAFELLERQARQDGVGLWSR